MKKIVFVTGVLSNGGAERVISILGKALCDKDYEVSIITVLGDKNDYVTDSRITIYPIIQNNTNFLLRMLKMIMKTRKLIKMINPDFVISFVAIINIITILSTRFLKSKVIVSERNDPYQNPERKLVRRLRDLLYNIPDGIVFQTHDAKKYFSKVIQKKGVIISNPIISNLPYWNDENENKTIITACRLSRQKNLPMLIEAFSQFKKNHPEYKLKIFGIGVLYDELSTLIYEKELEKSVFLSGFSNDIHKEMAESSLFVISSNYEGISNSMLEALAIGIPVISTDSPIGGAKMFIKNNQNGLLIDVGDENALLKGMEKIFHSKDFAKSLSFESQKIRKTLSIEAITNQWINYLMSFDEGSNEGTGDNKKIKNKK